MVCERHEYYKALKVCYPITSKFYNPHCHSHLLMIIIMVVEQVINVKSHRDTTIKTLEEETETSDEANMPLVFINVAVLSTTEVVI